MSPFQLPSAKFNFIGCPMVSMFGLGMMLVPKNTIVRSIMMRGYVVFMLDLLQKFKDSTSLFIQNEHFLVTSFK